MADAGVGDVQKAVGDSPVCCWQFGIKNAQNSRIFSNPALAAATGDGRQSEGVWLAGTGKAGAPQKLIFHRTGHGQEGLGVSRNFVPQMGGDGDDET